MPLPLFVIPAAIAGAAALARGVPAIMKTPQERANKKRIKELEAMGNAMGLTPEERKQLEAEHQASIDAAQGATDRAVSAQLANGGGGSGQAVAGAQLAGQQTIDATTQAARDIEAADHRRHAELAQELEDRYAFQSATRKARAAAIAEVPAAAAEGGLKAKNRQEELGLRNKEADAQLAQAGVQAGIGGRAGTEVNASIAKLSPTEREKLRALMVAKGIDPDQFTWPDDSAGGE